METFHQQLKEMNIVTNRKEIESTKQLERK